MQKIEKNKSLIITLSSHTNVEDMTGLDIFKF
jgi:hypothetical protein